MTAPGKYCPDCGEVRPRDEFYKNSRRGDGLSGYCGKHQLARDRSYRSKTAEGQQCNCGDFSRCMKCRNNEKRRAFKHGDIPAYRRNVIAQIVSGG